MDTRASKTFLIYHDSKTDAAALELEVRRHREIVVERIATITDLPTRLSSGTASCVILNFQKFELPLLALISKLQSLNPEVFFIVLYAQANPKAFEGAREKRNLVTMEKPWRNAAVSFVCEKISQGVEVKQRRFKRFVTDQLAQLSKLRSDEFTTVRVLNMSKGGAYIECSDSELKPQDVVKITIALDKLSKAHTFNARIMWVSGGGHSSRRFGVGLEFINSDDAYLSLMQKD